MSAQSYKFYTHSMYTYNFAGHNKTNLALYLFMYNHVFAQTKDSKVLIWQCVCIIKLFLRDKRKFIQITIDYCPLLHNHVFEQIVLFNETQFVIVGFCQLFAKS